MSSDTSARSSLKLANDPKLTYSRGSRLEDDGCTPIDVERTHCGDTAQVLFANVLQQYVSGVTSSDVHQTRGVCEWNFSGNKTKNFRELFDAMMMDAPTNSKKEEAPHKIKLILRDTPFTHSMSEHLASVISTCSFSQPDSKEDDPLLCSLTPVQVVELDISHTMALQASEQWAATFTHLATGQPDALDHTSFLKDHQQLPPLRSTLTKVVNHHDSLPGATTQLHPMLSSLGNLYSLQVLSLAHTSLDCASIKALVSGCIHRRHATTALNKSKAPIVSDTSAGFYISHYRQPRPPLKELYLQHNQIGASGLWDLADAFIGHGTEVVCLRHNAVGKLTATDNVSVKTFVKAKEVDADGGYPYDPRGLEALAAAVKRGQETLKVIDLSHNELGSSVVPAFDAKTGRLVKMVGYRSDRGGVSELCEATRWAKKFSAEKGTTESDSNKNEILHQLVVDGEALHNGLHIEHNFFNVDTVKALKRTAGFRLHAAVQEA